jgi:hypothetical protein
MTIAETHTAIAVMACVQADCAVGIFREFQFPVDVLSQNEQQVHASRRRVTLQVLASRDFPMTEIAGSHKVFDHVLLDAALKKGKPDASAQSAGISGDDEARPVIRM